MVMNFFLYSWKTTNEDSDLNEYVLHSGWRGVWSHSTPGHAGCIGSCTIHQVSRSSQVDKQLFTLYVFWGVSMPHYLA